MATKNIVIGQAGKTLRLVEKGLVIDPQHDQRLDLSLSDELVQLSKS